MAATDAFVAAVQLHVQLLEQTLQQHAASLQPPCLAQQHDADDGCEGDENRQPSGQHSLGKRRMTAAAPADVQAPHATGQHVLQLVGGGDGSKGGSADASSACWLALLTAQADVDLAMAQLHA